MKDIQISIREDLKQKPDQDHLEFGQHFTDHMFLFDYNSEQGWHDPRIVPYGPIVLEPAAMVLHYGQAVFEGMKAFNTNNGNVLLFRPQKNMERLNQSNRRLEIPEIDEEFILHAIQTLINVDKEWIPSGKGTSLYIRPFIIATEPCLGVRAAHNYQLLVILSPVGAYYSEGLEPVKINVESSYSRAVRGGLGTAKAAGNYAASIKAQTEAKEAGYSQVLWLDALERKYVEEVGSMNIFFKINGTVITPELNGSILAGVTRDSIIELLTNWGITVEERRISMDEIYQAHKDHTLEEVFGTGTAAVISPVGELFWDDRQIIINDGCIGELSQQLYDTITGIQTGMVPDTLQWTVQV
ncbi:branched-chain amino acid aminotransferase [Paenibacillus crassostreae]|uniref:Branched-chain-amino-acid aminotransferase n=1 Tax=Paenibacillus crassostreae TaxID=1763538 RepID=A0A167CH03_9BACL|nr:branched-chain amino acid aminotransferase [Paenibacillus crassostreae]AOZ91891.1 branched chain amino acid aminotransferase [Paenibacillus crassostreae]OAB73185.1 branched chain amino acid aminotransferase [Paenibacillus crassostreae]